MNNVINFFKEMYLETYSPLLWYSVKALPLISFHLLWSQLVLLTHFPCNYFSPFIPFITFFYLLSSPGPQTISRSKGMHWFHIGIQCPLAYCLFWLCSTILIQLVRTPFYFTLPSRCCFSMEKLWRWWKIRFISYK